MNSWQNNFIFWSTFIQSQNLIFFFAIWSKFKLLLQTYKLKKLYKHCAYIIRQGIYSCTNKICIRFFFRCTCTIILLVGWITGKLYISKVSMIWLLVLIFLKISKKYLQCIEIMCLENLRNKLQAWCSCCFYILIVGLMN